MTVTTARLMALLWKEAQHETCGSEVEDYGGAPKAVPNIGLVHENRRDEGGVTRCEPSARQRLRVGSNPSSEAIRRRIRHVEPAKDGPAPEVIQRSAEQRARNWHRRLVLEHDAVVTVTGVLEPCSLAGVGKRLDSLHEFANTVSGSPASPPTASFSERSRLSCRRRPRISSSGRGHSQPYAAATASSRRS